MLINTNDIKTDVAALPNAAFQSGNAGMDEDWSGQAIPPFT